ALERTQPQLTSVLPRRVKPGGVLTIKGRYLITPPALRPDVTVGDTAIPPASITIRPGDARADLQTVSVRIPETASAGDDLRLVVVPQGSSLPVETTIDVAGPEIRSVQPPSVVRAVGSPVRIDGQGFGDKQPDRTDAVTLGPLVL